MRSRPREGVISPQREGGEKSGEGVRAAIHSITENVLYIYIITSREWFASASASAFACIYTRLRLNV